MASPGGRKRLHARVYLEGGNVTLYPIGHVPLWQPRGDAVNTSDDRTVEIDADRPRQNPRVQLRA